MSSIVIYTRDGEKHDFPHKGRAGGSYTKRLHYEGVFVIVEDEWGRRTAFPAADVLRVEERPVRW